MSVVPGVDLVEVAEVAASIEAFGERYLRRLHRDPELERSRDWPPARRAEHLAGRFAAKEAVVKALRLPPGASFAWTDVEVTGDDGWPGVRLHGPLAAHAEQNGVVVEVSITHDHGRAVAFALAQPSASAAAGTSTNHSTTSNCTTDNHQE